MHKTKISGILIGASLVEIVSFFLLHQAYHHFVSTYISLNLLAIIFEVHFIYRTWKQSMDQSNIVLAQHKQLSYIVITYSLCVLVFSPVLFTIDIAH